MNQKTFAETIIAILEDLEATQRYVNKRNSANQILSERELQAKLHRYRSNLLESLTPLAAQEAVRIITDFKPATLEQAEALTDITNAAVRYMDRLPGKPGEVIGDSSPPWPISKIVK